MNESFQLDERGPMALGSRTINHDVQPDSGQAAEEPNHRPTDVEGNTVPHCKQILGGICGRTRWRSFFGWLRKIVLRFFRANDEAAELHNRIMRAKEEQYSRNYYDIRGRWF